MYQFDTVNHANSIITAFITQNITANDRELVASGYSRLAYIVDYPIQCDWTYHRYKHSQIKKHTTITDTRNQISDFVSLDTVEEALTEYVHENTVACYDCEERLWEHDRQYTNESGNTICESCRYDHYTTCDDCHDLIHHDDEVTDESGDISLCGSCYRSNYSTCTCCGRITPDSEISEDREQCESCYDDNHQEELEYPQPPRHEMFLATHRNGKAIKSELPPIGIELEFYADEDTKTANEEIGEFFTCFDRVANKALTDEDKTLRLSNRSWLTSDKDGSLYDRPNGIEIITRPFRIETWRTILEDAELERRYNAMVTTTTRKTGMHISTPSQLDGTTRHKVMHVFNKLCRYFDHDENTACEWIGRRPSDYCNNKPLDNESIVDQVKKPYGSKSGSMTLRNQPQPNAQTIQERLGRMEFRAPRTPDTFAGLKKRLTKFAIILKFCYQDLPNLYAMSERGLFTELEKFEHSQAKANA